MDLLASDPPRPRAQTGLTATIASGIAHGAILLLVLWQAGPAVIRELTDVLPALYLYAPDRRPAELREMRIPIPAPPGAPRGTPVPVQHEAPGSEAPVAPKDKLREGLVPPGRTTMRIDSVFSAISVDSEVVRYPSAAPIYPTKLLEQGVEGSVAAEFVVDTTGRVDLSTVRILISTNDEFGESVRTALAGALFRPAWRNLRKVRQLVQQRFSFKIYRGPDSVSS
ncbi:MAG TPA: TonB family protein [Gemmatimonadales bacterium]|nr:TonB family protein [Gemmatimonadales bacterium]